LVFSFFNSATLSNLTQYSDHEGNEHKFNQLNWRNIRRTKITASYGDGGCEEKKLRDDDWTRYFWWFYFHSILAINDTTADNIQYYIIKIMQYYSPVLPAKMKLKTFVFLWIRKENTLFYSFLFNHRLSP